MKRRVVVTGLGQISALGHNASVFWEKITRCESGIGPVEGFERGAFRFEYGAQVRQYEPEAHFPSKELMQQDRFSQFGVIAAREAVADAGIEWTDALRQKTCIVMGSSIGGEGAHDEGFRQLYRENKNSVHLMTIPRIMPNAAASNISMAFGITGPAFTVSTACASSNHAIGQAFWMLRNGSCEVAICGGSETPFYYGFLKAWEALRVVAPDTCRPFSKDRKGLILGEGGGILVLETLDSALERGANIYAEIVGFGMSSDAGHITRPEPAGAQRAMQAAMDDADIQAEQIDYINAHGTGTGANDAMETAAVRACLGAHADRIAMSATKSLHGHALGASSALEAVATALAIKHSMLPPTANYNEHDPECDLDIVPNEARPKHIHYALSNAFAFGGLNAVLAFRKFDP